MPDSVQTPEETDQVHCRDWKIAIARQSSFSPIRLFLLSKETFSAENVFIRGIESETKSFESIELELDRNSDIEVERKFSPTWTEAKKVT